MRYLSKSDFQVARTCPAKLFYKKSGYPSLRDEDEYAAFLADGGCMVEAIARLLHPGGIEIGRSGSIEADAARTLKALQSGATTLFEATFLSGSRMARVDILRRHAGRIELIEVKAKSIDSRAGAAHPFRGKRGGITAEWRPYIEDVAFQTRIVAEAFPGIPVEPWLWVVDQAKRCALDSIHSCFHLSRPAGKGRPVVTFTGDVDALRREHFLSAIDVRAEVDEVIGEVAAAAEPFAQSIANGLRKLPAGIGVHCRHCEYRCQPETPGALDGFNECWGALAAPDPHILDYYHVSMIGGRSTPLADALVRQGHASLADVRECDLVNRDGTVGAVPRRQRIQREHALAGSEYFGAGLRALLDSHSYPLHFVDFETSRSCVPYHSGMAPYEQVAFQFSCHTLASPGATPQHFEWINIADAYPNAAFARALMRTLGERGTVYTWSHHERSVLADILRQMADYHIQDGQLRAWLEAVVAGGGALQMVDLCETAQRHYFHPRMRGRLSIKHVLPAVWEANPSLHIHPEFARYCRRDGKGALVNPYETLAPLPFSSAAGCSEEAVRDGTGAIRAYQEMLYGLSRRDPLQKEQWRRLLLQYCRLDTAAMLMIWMHWRQRAAT